MNQKTEADANKARANNAWIGLDERRIFACIPDPRPTPAMEESTVEGTLRAFRLIVTGLGFNPFDPND